jgi:dihydropteroate synthase
VVLVIDDIDGETRDLLLTEATRVGADCVTGEGWVVLSDTVAALAAMARPDTTQLAPSLAEDLAGALAGVADAPREWRMGRGTVPLDRPVIVGILNVTPDSFSDGGRFIEPDAAVRQAEALVGEGAGMLDVGAESTRPGQTTPLDPTEEWRRLAPVLEAVASRFPDVPLSVDTVRSATARRALAGGAWAINDVSGLRHDPGIATACADCDAGLILMHSRGSVGELAGYRHARYGHVTAEVVRELRVAVGVAEQHGVSPDRLVLDPGLGFGKTPEHNLQALRDLPMVASLGFPVMVGPSRKRFLGEVTGREVGQRDVATAAACVTAYLGGAMLFRVHAVEPTRDALAVVHAVRSA